MVVVLTVILHRDYCKIGAGITVTTKNHTKHLVFCSLYDAQLIIHYKRLPMSKSAYDDDPVFYCKRCLSLNIRKMPFVQNQDYCDNCGAVDIGTTDIDTWNKMYKEKYGHEHIVKQERKWPYWC